MDPSSDVCVETAHYITDLLVCQACHADPIDISYSVWYCKPCSLLAYPPYDSGDSPTRSPTWDTPQQQQQQDILCEESLSPSPPPPPTTPTAEDPPAPTFIDETPLVDSSAIAALEFGDMRLDATVSHESDENYWRERIRANNQEVPAYADKKAHNDAFKYVLARMKHSYLSNMLASKMSKFKEEKRRRRYRGTKITTAFKMVKAVMSERVNKN